MFEYKDAYASSLKYFNGDEMAADVFLKKYALRDKSNNILEKNPDDMHRRLAREFARIEKKYPNPMSEDEIYELFKNFARVVPQGSPMSGIGNDYRLQSLSNCFVISSPADSYGGICYADQELTQIMKRRGGVGLDISNIRPKGLATDNAAQTTDGIGVFMEKYSNTCREVAQGGRRGALMLTIDVRHPEIETFINIKRDLKKVTGANISIRVSDEFMHAVENDDEFMLRWPIDSASPLITRSIRAKDIWQQMMNAAWTSAEPGILFWDTVLRQTPADAYASKGFRTVSTNPCGELVLCPLDSCRLLLINLMTYVHRPFTKNATFDFASYKSDVIKAQRLMDDMIDLEIENVDKIIAKVNSDPQPAHIKQIELDLWKGIRQKALDGRRTGLGITALGDALARLNIKYASAEAVDMTETIYKELALSAHKSSVIMAKERGAFLAFEQGLWDEHPFMNMLAENSDEETNSLFKQHGRRNICLTTTAPAGSVSSQTQSTSGIEPVFLLSYIRRRKLTQNDVNVRVDFIDDMGDRWQEYVVYHPGVKQWMDVTGDTDVKNSPYYGATSADINWEMSVDMQAVAQKWIEHSISKTCNLPNNVDVSLVSNVYMRAWKKGCKGFTIYRAGSRAGVLIENEGDDKKQIDDKKSSDRPKELPCKIHHMQVKGEAWTVLVGLHDGRPYEVFGGLSSQIEVLKKYDVGIIIKNSRKTTNSTYDLRLGNGEGFLIKNIVEQFDNPNQSATTRLISLILRHGASIELVVDQLQKDKNADMFSFSKCISRVLKTYIKDGTSVKGKACPNCSSTSLAYIEGCMTCTKCSWSKCS
jgi:ribonucleoside-diphosphate reductase alpha chain